jgi:hypothetical protein
MPKQSRATIRAKTARIGQYIAQNPGLTIQAANNELRDSGDFKYRLTRHRASPVVRASRAAVAEVRAQVAEALGLNVEVSST